jgi:hypothetical protein
MEDPDEIRVSEEDKSSLASFLALTIGPPFANRLEPRIFGLPFLLAYLVFWVLATPLFMLVASWIRRPR